MMRKWLFLTGSLPRLQRVWQSYGVGAAVIKGMIDHTPATFVIDPQGRETRLFLSQMSYSSVPQLAEVMARGIAAALPGRPRVRDSVSLSTIKLLGPHRAVSLRRVSGAGRTTRLGPHTGPHLLLFFDTWEKEVSDLSSGLLGLNGYAARDSVAPLAAVDEANVEPSAQALPNFLRRIPGLGPRYPVAVDPDGRVADGYGVQDSPWLTLVSAKGKILWWYDVAVKGWPSTAWLVSHVHAALAHGRQ